MGLIVVNFKLVFVQDLFQLPWFMVALLGPEPWWELTAVRAAEMLR